MKIHQAVRTITRGNAAHTEFLDAYRAPLMYQSEGVPEPAIPSLGILKWTISGERPLHFSLNDTAP